MSSWSDSHEITLTPQGNSYSATKDVTISENDGANGDSPTTYSTTSDEEQSGPSSSEPPSRSSGHSEGIAATQAASKGYPSEHRISPAAFGNYATAWTSGSHAGDSKSNFNSKYPYYTNNCANFASQTLNYGGWYLTGGNSFQVKSENKWTYNLAGVAGATRTWSNAPDLDIFAYHNGTYSHLDNIWNATRGDLLFVDWDPHGKSDGTIDHVMVVSGVIAKGIPMISQKSNNRSNVNLYAEIAMAKSQGKTRIVWYGLKHL